MSCHRRPFFRFTNGVVVVASCEVIAETRYVSADIELGADKVNAERVHEECTVRGYIKLQAFPLKTRRQETIWIQ